jgi:hypothetical protein
MTQLVKQDDATPKALLLLKQLLHDVHEVITQQASSRQTTPTQTASNLNVFQRNAAMVDWPNLKWGHITAPSSRKTGWQQWRHNLWLSTSELHF